VKTQPGTHTISIRLAPLKRAGMGTPAHWVQAAQEIWLTVHGHADRNLMCTQINLYTNTKGVNGQVDTLTHTHKANFLSGNTNRIH